MGNQGSKSGGKLKYRVPPGATKPGPPSRPLVEYIGDEVVVRWIEPLDTGGCPIMGYVLQFNRVDGNFWESYRVDGTECVLKNLDDTFIFRVIAENILGYSEPSDASLPVSCEFTEPTVLVPLNNKIRAIEFEKVELNCRIWGMPGPEITWYLNGEEVARDGRIHMYTDGIDHKLLFHHIKISDEGEVRIRGRNALGETESTGAIIVEAPPRIKYTKHYEEGIVVRAGENLRLKFAFTGRPRPEVSWYHEGELVHAPNMRTEEIADVTILSVEGVNRHDAGEYTLRLENNIGEDVSHVLVTVIDRPHPPGKPLVILMPDNSCLLEWESGNDEPVGYIVEYFRDGWGVWLKALSTRHRGCKIRDLIPGSKYMFRIKAENHFGISDPGQDSVQIYIPESKKEHGNVMSSIQEDEFEVFSELKPDSKSTEHLQIPPIPSRNKSPTGLGQNAPRPNSLFSNLMNAVDAAQQKNKDQLSATATKSQHTLSVPRTSNSDLASSDNESLSDQPSPIAGRSVHRSSVKRSHLIGNAGVNKSDESISSVSSSQSDKHKIFDHYGRPIKPGGGGKGLDRFERHRKDSRLEKNAGPRMVLGSDKGSCDELEAAVKDNNFVIVEDGGDDYEDGYAEEEFVVSQLVVPVKQGSVKISTSFDNGSVAASSVKSSFDDLTTSDALPPTSTGISRTNTPDQIIEEEEDFHIEAEPRPPTPPKGGGKSSHLNKHATSQSSFSPAADIDGSHSNLLYALHQEMEDLKKGGPMRESKESLLSGRGGSRSRGTTPARTDGLLTRDENTYIGRYGTGGRLSTATMEKLYGKSNISSVERGRRMSAERDFQKEGFINNGASSGSKLPGGGEPNSRFAKSNTTTGKGTSNGEKETAETKANQQEAAPPNAPNLGIPPTTDEILNHLCVLFVLALLSPALLNPIAIPFFCLFLIKLTWM